MTLAAGIKIAHITSIFIFLTASSLLIYLKTPSGLFKALAGISNALILLTGMSLVIHMKFEMSFWIMGKVLVWVLLISVLAIFVRRFKQKSQGEESSLTSSLSHGIYGLLILLAATATALALVKPNLQ